MGIADTIKVRMQLSRRARAPGVRLLPYRPKSFQLGYGSQHMLDIWLTKIAGTKARIYYDRKGDCQA
jgi:hypothetical protein